MVHLYDSNFLSFEIWHNDRTITVLNNKWKIQKISKFDHSQYFYCFTALTLVPNSWFLQSLSHMFLMWSFCRSFRDADLPSSGQRTEQNSHYCYTIQKVFHLMDIHWHISKFTTGQTILMNQQVLSRVHRGGRWSVFLTRSPVTRSQTFTNR